MDDCGNYGVLVSDDALFNHQSGLLDLTNMPEIGLNLLDHAILQIGSLATLNISNVSMESLIIDIGATLDCQGVMNTGQ